MRQNLLRDAAIISRDKYASHAFQDKLTEHGMVCSMSRKGNCWYNALSESFFNSLKNERVHGTRDEAIADLFAYIEPFYNAVRPHSSLQYLTPHEFRRQHQPLPNRAVFQPMQISANGISLEVEDHGPPSGEPLLLIMGLGMQLLGWHVDFVATLVQRGFRVVRFDNRDVGLSTSLDSAGQPNLAIGALRFSLGLRVRSAYTLADMAADSVGVLDGLGIARAHVCGASMGGMIAQRMADRAPDRVKSLTLMTTSSGSRKLPGPSLKVRGALIARPADPQSVESIVEHYVKLDRLTGSPAYPASKSYLRECFTTAVNRSHRPAGTARQLMAVAGDGDRTRILSGIRIPTHVIHGAADVLVPVQAGRDLAARIPGATLDIVEGMGHDLPRELWPRFADGIGRVAARS